MKKITVRVIPNARRNEVITEGSVLKVRVSAPAVEGKANEAVVDLLSEFFKVKKRCIRIVKGAKSREKIIEIIE